MAAVAASDAPQPPVQNGTVDDRKQRLDRLNGANSTDDAMQFVTAETNDDMKRMMHVTVGRMATPLGKQKVDRNKFVHYLKEKQGHEADCWNFPFVIMYFISFAVVVLFHENIANVSQVERLMRGMMEGTGFEGLPVSGHKSMDDIDLVVDIWTFLNDAAVPWFIPNLGSTQTRDINRVMRYNQLIGGVQLQQIRRKKRPCSDEYPDLGPMAAGTDTNPLLVGFACYPWDSVSNECFGPHGCTNATGKCAGWCPVGKTSRRLSEATTGDEEWQDSWLGLGASYWSDMGRRLANPTRASKVRGQATKILSNGPKSFDGVYTVTLHEHEGLTKALKTVSDLKKDEWLDTATSWFALKVFVLNPDLAVFTHMIVNVFFAPSGQLLPEVTMQSFPAAPYQSSANMAADFVFGVLWLHLFVTTLVKMSMAVSKGRAKAYFGDVWNWLTILTVLIGAAILALWVVFLGRLSTVKDLAMNTVLSRPIPGANPPFASAVQESDYLKATDNLHDEVSKLSGFLMMSRLLICWYTILIMFRFFQAFKAQPRLAVVTNTITRSFTDLVHFLVVLIVVMLAYAIAAMFLFGQRLLQFSEVGPAVNACFLIMIGDFDYSELAAEDPPAAALWFWSYMILVTLIMLNMLLAIIMDVYTEVKMDASDQDAVWTQARKMASDAWEHRDWIKLQLIVDQVRNLPGSITHLDKDLLLESLPDMVEPQALALIAETLESEKHDENKGMSISDAMKMVGWIKVAVQKIARRIEDILMIEKEEKKILLSQNGSGPAKVGGKLGGVMPPNTAAFDPASDQKMQAIDKRLGQMENFLNESMVFSVYRAKEMRNRLNVIEDLLQGNSSSTGNATPAAPDEWDAPSIFARQQGITDISQPPASSGQPALTNFSC